MYGRANERFALQAMEIEENIKIVECGLFIDEEMYFLGATPDGILERDHTTIVEVKCPPSCAELFPHEAVLQKKFTFWSTNKEKTAITGVNKKHLYYFQVQGQLHVTKAKRCLFGLWTKKGIKTEIIEKDDEFWDKEMKEKLNAFYFDCLLPEIVDPRYTRSMPIRDPSYILEAIKKKELDKEKKKK